MNLKTLLAICFVAVTHAPTSHAERKVVVQNKTYNLTCNQRSSSGDPTPVIVWIINEKAYSSDQQDKNFKVYLPVTTIIDETTKITRSTLNVVPLPRHSNTNVSCNLIGDRYQLYTWTLLVEREPPRIVTPPEGATFVEGTVSTFNCTSIYDVNITWSIGGKPFGEVVALDSLADGGTVGVVAFVARRSQHRRELKCEIPSAVEGATEPPPASEVVLSIVYPPYVTSHGRIRGNHTFWCEADAKPAANISWVGPEDSEIEMETQSWIEGNDYGAGDITRSELKVDPGFATGIGGYTCIASNAYGNSSATILLTKKHLLLIIGIPVGVFSFGVVFIVLVSMVLMKWRPCAVTPSDPIYDTTVPEGSLGLARRLSTFVTGTWKRGSWFGSAQCSTMELDAMNRPRLDVPKLDE